MTVAAEELALKIKLLDEASAGTGCITARIHALGASGAVAAAGLSVAASAAAALGAGVERGAARLVGAIDGIAGRILRTGKWIALAGAGFAAWEIKNAVKLHGELADMEKVVTQLTGSSAKAREMVRMLFAEAAKPGAPAISELREAVQALAGMGADPTVWLRRMLDAAVGTGQALSEVVSEFRMIWLGGQQAALAYKRLGISPEAFGIAGKDRAADMGRLATALEARFGGLAEKAGGGVFGAIGAIRARVEAFLYEATGPVVTRFEADLKSIDAALGRTLGGSAAQRLGQTVAALYDTVSARAREFILTGQTQGWRRAFGNLWRDIEPEIVRALKWAGQIAATAFWEAFKAVVSGAARGEGWALGLIGYEGLKLGGAGLAVRGAERLATAASSRWLGKGAEFAGTAGATALGDLAARKAFDMLRAQSALGGAAAGPPVEYLLGGAGAAGAAGAGESGWLAAIGGVGAVAAVASAVLAALGLWSAFDAIHQQRTKGVEEAGGLINWVGGALGRWRARDRGAEAAEKKAMDLAAESRAAQEALGRFKGALADVIGGLEARIHSFTSNQAQIESMVGSTRKTVQEEYKDLIRKTWSPEERGWGGRPGLMPAPDWTTARRGLVRGNIDTGRRPVVHNADGTWSTVLSFTTNINGENVLLPLISDLGIRLTRAQAEAEYLRTGKHLGKFAEAALADEYGQRLHETQAAYYDVPKGDLSLMGDIAAISKKIAEIDYSRVAAGADLLEMARKHLGLLDEQWDKTKALAAEAEAIRSAEMTEARAGILMGPAEYAQREAVKRAVKAMAPEDFATAWQAGRLKDVLGKYNMGDVVSEAQMTAWRARVGLGPFSEGGGGLLTAGKEGQDAARARIEAETKARTAEATRAVQVEIGAIQVALNITDKDRIIDAVTLAIDKVEKEVKGAIEEALKNFKDEIGRRDK